MIRNVKRLTRRGFLQEAAGALVAAGVPMAIAAPRALARPGPNDRINIGCIGVGDRGTAVMNGFLVQPDAQVVAVCDVKRSVLQAAQRRVNEHYASEGCAAYADFRELLARPDIDGVLVATPDHWHVLAAWSAARAGKDVYLEKPMGLTLGEDYALRSAVRRYGRIFQFGTQQRSEPNFRFACEIARSGRLGKLRTINAWCVGSAAGGSPAPLPVPEGLDYDMWLGPAPAVPYTEDRCSNRFWWYISDYALGFIAGWGVHPLDIALWGGEPLMTGPWEIEGRGVFPTEGVCDTALSWRVLWRFGSGLIMDYAGGPVPAEWQQRYKQAIDHGTAFEGSDGWVHVNRAGINAEPAELLSSPMGPHEPRLVRSTGHVPNFLESMRTRQEAVSSIDAAVGADALCQLSEIAIRREQKIRWDPVGEQFLEDPGAARWLARPMRAPWHL